MDRGAARSRKRAFIDTRGSGPADAGPSSGAFRPRAEGDRRPPPPGAGQRSGPGAGGPRPDRPARPPRPEKKPKQLLDEATRYKPKAIRSAAALIWSQAEFAIPPPKDVLEGVRRIDLAGSGVSDVGWLSDLGVTWLNLAGCEIKAGWEAVGSLKELSVLNISNCGLTQLPPSLAGLTKLKALVAMGNDWTSIDGEVLSSWKDLNSLIVSHSPVLTSLPPSLAQSVHLSKLTFSHCPKLTAKSLPDLSPLPVLRDIKMNNLPLLTSLPSHIHTWGTGDLSLTRKPRPDESDYSDIGESSIKRLGEGLEVLDLGNCSLPYMAIEPFFINPKAKEWAQLRSLTLHSNPLATTHPNYSELLQAADALPNLQIIDAKRVVERKRKGEVSESKKERIARERREGKMTPSGANAGGVTEMRKWGGEADEREPAAVTEGENKAEKKVKKRKAEGDGGERIKKIKTDKSKTKVDKAAKDETRKVKKAVEVAEPGVTPIDSSLDPSAATAPARKANKPAKEPVFEVIDVQKAAAEGEKVTRAERRLKEKKDKKAGKGKVAVPPEERPAPVDLKDIFGTSKAAEDDTGLGVGGW